MRAEIILTVAESKRLIALGVAQLDFVRERLRSGIVVVTAGSTNAYIYEELTGQRIDKRAYVSGRTTPARNTPGWKVQPLPDLVLVNGQPTTELDRFTVVAKMQEGDVYMKGANVLNYAAGVAGITIGNPTGGTIGAALGHIVGKKLRFIIPVGLEKEVPFSIEEAAELTAETDERMGPVHSIWPVRGLIYTEIEALATLAGVEAYPVAAGGVAGAEGGLRLLVVGDAAAVREALAIAERVQGEPPLA
jgi:hypothetical protein